METKNNSRDRGRKPITRRNSKKAQLMEGVRAIVSGNKAAAGPSWETAIQRVASTDERNTNKSQRSPSAYSGQFFEELQRCQVILE